MSEAPYQPAETPADADRPNQPPRYSASASVPVPPPAAAPNAGPASFSSAPGPGGATYGGMPGSPFSQGTSFGQPKSPAPLGQPPVGQPPAGQSPVGQPPGARPAPAAGKAPASAQARASASVPPPSPGGTYGSVAPSYGNPPAPAAPTFGATAGSTYGSAPAGYASLPGGFVQPASGASGGGAGGGGFEGVSMFGQPPAPQGPPPQQQSAPQGGTYGATQSQGGYGSASPGYAPPPPSYPSERGGAPGGATYGQGAYGQPSAGDSGRSNDTDWSSPPVERTPKRGLIIALIVTAVLVVVGVGAYVGWSMKNGDADFAVGTCVQQRGSDAAIVDCSTPDAYKITSIVDAENGCPEPNRPSLVLTRPGSSAKQYACLAPAAGS